MDIPECMVCFTHENLINLHEKFNHLICNQCLTQLNKTECPLCKNSIIDKMLHISHNYCIRTVGLFPLARNQFIIYNNGQIPFHMTYQTVQLIKELNNDQLNLFFLYFNEQYNNLKDVSNVNFDLIISNILSRNSLKYMRNIDTSKIPLEFRFFDISIGVSHP